MEPQKPANKPSPNSRVDNSLAVTQSGEKTIFNIHRHPIGIFGVYFAAGIVLIVAAILGFIVPDQMFSSSSNSAIQIGALAFLIVAVVTLVFVAIATKVYWGNQWILTTDSITQVSQKSLFSRESSQLSLANVEDVSAAQNGILAHILGYGLIKVETASEQGKFVFNYCPKPNYYAQQVLAAREAYEQDIEQERMSAGQPSPRVPQPQTPGASPNTQS